MREKLGAPLTIAIVYVHRTLLYWPSNRIVREIVIRKKYQLLQSWTLDLPQLFYESKLTICDCIIAMFLNITFNIVKE